MITWGYYGQEAWTYLCDRSTVSERLYQAVFCLFVVGTVLTGRGPSRSDRPIPSPPRTGPDPVSGRARLRWRGRTAP